MVAKAWALVALPSMLSQASSSQNQKLVAKVSDEAVWGGRRAQRFDTRGSTGTPDTGPSRPKRGGQPVPDPRPRVRMESHVRSSQVVLEGGSFKQMSGKLVFCL